MKDTTTLAFYSSEASRYVSRQRAVPADISAFLDLVPAGGKIFELGCGSGQDSAVMLERGFDVTPTDGSPEMVLEAERRLKRAVRVLLFSDLSEVAVYNGVWASACLLHVPREDLSDVLFRVHRALVPGGVFYASYKAGEQAGRDALGRYYNYLSSSLLRSIYAGAASWKAVDVRESDGGGYDGQPTRWLSVFART